MGVARALPSDYAFHAVKPSDEDTRRLSDGRALEQIHRLLQSQEPERYAVQGSLLVRSQTSATSVGRRSSLMLLGIMSGSEDVNVSSKDSFLLANNDRPNEGEKNGKHLKDTKENIVYSMYIDFCNVFR